MASLDYSQPLSDLLRTGTAVAHDNLEHSDGAGWLVRGELDRDEYVRFLMMLWHVYDALESALAHHAANPALAPSYNPTLLSRTAALDADISHFLDVPSTAWLSHPIAKQLSSSPPAPLSAYTSRLSFLSSTHPHLLLAHAYVRYLGDLSGGQTIKRRVAKAYGLDTKDSRGIEFYEFNQPGSGSATGSLGDMKRIKEWYRDAMNSGVGDDERLKAAIVEEANTAFTLNAGLFSTLRAPSRHKPTPLTLSPSSTPALGDPTTPLTSAMSSPSTPNSTSQSPIEDDENKWVTNVPQPKPLMDIPKDGGYSVTSVVVFIVAVGLAHFIIVVGGFSGQRGYDKLVAVAGRLGITI
ncbi:heme oxygenase-like protein [Neolentinus lepideus HHB14362 ss-1]|uniref:Heme oxygenase-like protein n=1 Tax=Neolentinus lepideus HHB14362 ss-1 TaxID=1314782 RepID=A0A165NE79_9AGAM|nr:heme oxygenase-like protein [Neolentinus lepideus HHB14362 ss-1]